MASKNVSAPLPELDLGPNAQITVDTGDPAAIVTSLVVFGTYFPPDGQDVQTGPFMLVPGPGA